MDLGVGECFGEDYFCFNVPNTYSVKIESITASLIWIDKNNFLKKYKRVM